MPEKHKKIAVNACLIKKRCRTKNTVCATVRNKIREMHLGANGEYVSHLEKLTVYTVCIKVYMIIVCQALQDSQ